MIEIKKDYLLSLYALKKIVATKNNESLRERCQ